MTEIEEKIANMARAINRQIGDLAYAEARLTKNVMITEDGKIYEIENHMVLKQSIQDKKNVLDDMLRMLDGLIKERDGVNE